MVLIGLTAGQVKADIFVDLLGVAIVGSEYEYTYSATLSQGSFLTLAPAVGNSVNGFTVYDFVGLVPGSIYNLTGSLATFFTPFELLVGITPTTPVPDEDNPAIPNLWFKYTNVPPPADLTAPGANLLLGTFTVRSTQPPGGILEQIGISQNITTGGRSNNIREVIGPAAIPEPSTLVLAGLGSLGLIGFAIRRKRYEGSTRTVQPGD
jgi:hypothetical protein